MTDPSSPPTQSAEHGSRSSWIPPIIGSMLLFLPVATCVQAWLADAPGKVWLTVLAILAIAIGIVAWRFRVSLVFWCGLIVSSVLTIVPAYLYGVDSAELAVAGISFRLFIPCLFLVSLTLAAWELARLPRLPLWARFVAPAIALFAAVPVVIGLTKGVPFTEVLAGLWNLPYWIQGAWFGAAVLLPIALIASLLRTAVPAWRAEPFRKMVTLGTIAIFLTTTLATGFAMTTQGLIHAMAFVPVPAYSAKIKQETGRENSASASPSETSLAVTTENAPQPETLMTGDPALTPFDAAMGGSTAQTAEPATTRGSAGVLWQQLEAAVAQIPRDHFDPAAVIAQVGTDPEALFAWVRDETVLLPYCGALKGPEGVLLDRGGNALDRALLLRELLAQAGHQSRLAHAEMTPEQTAMLVAALGRVVPVTSAAATDPTALADRAAAELGLDAAQVRAELDRAARAETDLQAALAARTERQSKALLKAVGFPTRPGIDVASFLADHWWVLLERPGAEPLDLDPSLASAKAGDHIADSTLQLDLTSLAQLAAVGGTCGERLHSIRVRAVAEVFDGDKLVEHILLDHELLPIDLFGRSLALIVVARGGPQAPDPFSQTAPAAALIAALLQDNEWQPLLTIDKEKMAGKAVTATGEVRDEPGRSQSGGGAFGGFGGGLGGGDDSDGRFTALWWTFEVRTPGVGTVSERRQVFDLIGPAARAAGATGETDFSDEARTARALALAGQTELAVLPSAPTTDLLNFVAASRLLAERDAWQALYDQGKTLPMTAINERLNALGALRTPLERFALDRGRFAVATGAAPQIGLMVLAHHRRLRADLSTDQAFDVIAAAPGTAATQQHGFAARLRAGVTDTNLEALLTAGQEPRPEGIAVADAFDRDPGSWRIVRRSSELNDTVLAADLAARVANDLAAGFVALVPGDARDAVGWWRIDPATGATLGFGSRGWGQAMTGYSEQVGVVVQVRGVINQYASMGQCLGLALTQPLRGIEGVSNELTECVFKLVCGSISSGLGMLVQGPQDWTNVILAATVNELWSGTPELGFGGFCGALWSRLK